MVMAKSKTAGDKIQEKKKSSIRRDGPRIKDKATPSTAGKKAPKPRPSRIRKPKPPPDLPQPLTALPAEVLNLVIQYIIPPQICFINPPLHPSATPYPPINKNVTSRLKARSERWGTIPEGLLDIISLSRCCRQTRDACSRLIGSFGGSVKEMEIKKEITDSSEANRAYSPPRATNILQADHNEPGTSTMRSEGATAKSGPDVTGCKQLYLRVSHCSTTGDNLAALMLQARDTLEHVVLFNCGADHGSSSLSRTEEGSESPMNQTVPLQYGRGKDYIALPNLTSVQVGPKMCGQCSQACLRLLAGRNFYQHEGRDRYDKSSWFLTKQTAGWPMHLWTQHKFDHVAAPKLEAIQQFLPVPANRGRHADSRMLGSYHPMLDKQVTEKLKSFSLILPNLDRRWGGFGVSGFSSNVHQKTKEQVEQDLAERSRIYLMNPGPAASRRRAQETKHVDKVKEKWAALAKTALVKPIASLGDEAARAAALALVSSIKPLSGSVEKGKGKATSEKALNAVEIGVMAANDGVRSSDGGVENITATEASGSVEFEGIEANKGKGKAVGEVKIPVISTLADITTSLESPPSPVPLKPDLDNSGSPSRKRLHSSSSSDSETAGPTAGPSQIRPRPRRRPQEEDANGPVLSEYDRQAITNRVRLQENFPRLLRDIVNAFPNLISLQVLRQSMRVDIVEDRSTPDESATIYVDPLRSLTKLEHLDLGLAVVGRRELRDFPLNLTLPEAESGMNPLIARDFTIRKKLLEADIIRATREGDAWRKQVLDRFVLGKSIDGKLSRNDNEDDDDDPFAQVPATLADATDPGDDLPHRGWPRTLKTGFIYKADIKERQMGRGELVSWEKAIEEAEETLRMSKSKIML